MSAGWTIEAAAQVAALEEDRAIELSEALARHCLIQLVREACRHVLPVRPAAGLALLGDVPKVAGPRAMFLFLDRVGDLFGLGNASALWGWARCWQPRLLSVSQVRRARTPLSLMKPSAWWRLSASTALG